MPHGEAAGNRSFFFIRTALNWCAAQYAHVQVIGLRGLVSLTQERGIWKEGMCKADLVAVLSECSDMHNTQPWVELIFKERNTRAFSHPEHTETCGHVCLFLPKCHPELHCKIECGWALSKQYVRIHCEYTIASLCINIPASFSPTVIRFSTIS